MYSRAFKNSVLKSLGPEIVSRLSLRPVLFELGHEIEFPGKPIDHLVFVEEGMASMTTTFEDGTQVEVSMFGYESIIGVSALMGTKRSLNRVYTQIAGSGYSCPVETARREFAQAGPFHSLALRYVQAQFVQTAQTAACNVKHGVDQRFARWLLLCADRTHSTTFKLSHELLSHMLGNTRSSVSIAAGVFKAEGLIEYAKGTVHIPDIARLEKRSCECYRVIKDHLDNYTEFDSGIVA